MSVRIATERGTVQHGSANLPRVARSLGQFSYLPHFFSQRSPIRTIGPVSSALVLATSKNVLAHINQSSLSTSKSARSRTSNFSRSEQTKPMLLNHLVRILGALKSMSFNSILGFPAEITAWSNALPFASRNQTLQWFTSSVVATILIKGVNGTAFHSPLLLLKQDTQRAPDSDRHTSQSLYRELIIKQTEKVFKKKKKNDRGGRSNIQRIRRNLTNVHCLPGNSKVCLCTFFQSPTSSRIHRH